MNTKRFCCLSGLPLACAAGLLAWQAAPPAKDLSMPWAFPVYPVNVAKDAPHGADDGQPKHIPGSTKAFTMKHINDYFDTPDWFPNDHPAWPMIVQYGRKPVIACAFCHLGSGLGHPESANIAGLPAAYMIRQIALMKTDTRKNCEPMNAFAKVLTDEEVRVSCEYFATLKPRPFYKVVETTMAPKSYLDSEFMRLPRPGGAMEPLGNRIITLPQDVERVERLDPYAGFSAYVPPGSLRKGEQLVKTGGGKTIACDICHGPGLRGLAEVPRIAGLHPIYIMRQLYKFQDGRNGGTWAQLMKAPTAKLNDDDILSIAAYVGSLTP
jgi:cytochrome c553